MYRPLLSGAIMSSRIAAPLLRASRSGLVDCPNMLSRCTSRDATLALTRGVEIVVSTRIMRVLASPLRHAA